MVLKGLLYSTQPRQTTEVLHTLELKSRLTFTIPAALTQGTVTQ